MSEEINITYTQDEIDKRALKIVMEEKQKWDIATVFVTEKVAFQMRYLIRQLRKNYWGVFDNPYDQATGRQKTWIHLTRSFVENIVKSIDLDTKDINFRAKKPEGYAITDVTRAAVRDYLEKDNFGEKLDVLERDLAIDGTVVWKTYDFDGECRTKQVDLLNIYIDPTEESIKKAYRFTERARLLPSQIAAMDGWRNINIKDLPGSTMLSPNDSMYYTISYGTTASERDVWEMWGKIPKSFSTKLKSDDKYEVDGRIVVSGIEVGNAQVHLVEDNDGKKPYEEVRYRKVNNRWYGVGPAEDLMWLQIWLNAIVNIRINRNYVSQLGLFKIKQGAGITPAMLTRLSANGAILVKDQDDIQPLETPAADNSSYQDENIIQGWAQKSTGAYNIAVGEQNPASTTATAIGVQNTNAQSGFVMIKETIGLFIQRWLDNQALPIIAKGFATGDLIKFSYDDSEFRNIVESVVAHEAMTQLEEFYKKGLVPTQEVLMKELKNAEEKIMRRKGFFVKLVEKIVAENLETQVYITNEEMDVGVMINNLIQMIPLAPQYQDATVKEIYDLMGLPQPKAQPQAQQQQPGQQVPGAQGPQQMGPQQAPQQAPQPMTPQKLVTNANVPVKQQTGKTAGPRQGRR